MNRNTCNEKNFENCDKNWRWNIEHYIIGSAKYECGYIQMIELWLKISYTFSSDDNNVIITFLLKEVPGKKMRAVLMLSPDFYWTRLIIYRDYLIYPFHLSFCSVLQYSTRIVDLV